MEDFIGRFFIEDTSVCDQAIEWFELNKHLARSGRVNNSDGQDGVEKNVKESLDITAYLEDYYQINSCFVTLLDFLWKCVQDYIHQFSELEATNFQLIEPINFQKYVPPTGGFKSFHCERGSKAKSNRCLVWMIYLNNVMDDGGTEFKYYKHIENAEKGKLLLWPPDFTHTHRGIVSKTEEKYILTGWYSFM